MEADPVRLAAQQQEGWGEPQAAHQQTHQADSQRNFAPFGVPTHILRDIHQGAGSLPLGRPGETHCSAEWAELRCL